MAGAAGEILFLTPRPANHTPATVNLSRQLGLLGAAIAAVTALGLVRAQNAPGTNAGGGFSMPFKKSGKTYLWFKGSGTEAVSTTVVRIRDFRVETFNDDETPALVGEAPECLLNLTTKNASSAGTIRISQAGGRFTHAGEGFSWDHENGRLILSNRVHSTIRLSPFGPRKK